MRTKIVAGNWKMNMTLDEGLQLVHKILDGLKTTNTPPGSVMIAPPFPLLRSIAKLLDGQEVVQLGAQNCHAELSGAYTGEVSVKMLQSVGVQQVIIGHSERRQYFKEDHAGLAAKTKTVLEAGLTPVFCCGEPLEVRENGMHETLVALQLKESLFELPAAEFAKVVIAYEPVWAIGTGKTATAEQAQDMHAFIRKTIAAQYDASIAEGMTILYGGSCKPGNAAELFSQPDVDGGLIGGASLKADDFLAIIGALH